jgi:ELP3 family radical SAM enzyme/protein acetyltransferase
MQDLEDIIKAQNSDLKFDYDENLLIDLLNHLINWSENIYEKHMDSLKEKQIFVLLRGKLPKEMQKYLRSYKIQISKPVLLYYYRKFIQQNRIKENTMMCLLLIKKPANDISGINQITILTSPTPDGQNFSCKHDCFYCPNEPGHEDNNWVPQPRSYLSKEPAVQRANRNKFEPDLQTQNRLDSLLSCGHKCDKIEFILEGGTFTEYPKKYLKKFFTKFIYTVNTYFDKIKRDMYTIEEEITLNKHAKSRIIGICIETRPDAILELDEDGIPWTQTLLDWGVTRIQLGVQQVDNYILKKINRGHTIEKVVEAIEVCKDNCFKIDIHLMPDLPYSTPEKDIAMFDEIYKSDKYQPDQIKIYPCEVVPWTKIEKWHKEGSYKPYGEDKELITKVLQYGMTQCPPWIRLPRVIRDIPDTYISGGVKCGNMRQVINDKIGDEKLYSMDIRYREIERHPEYDADDARLFVRKIRASNGYEYFISFETYDQKAIFGFLRLRIPDKFNKNHIVHYDTLNNKGMIRELHVYGSVQKVHSKYTKNSIQHTGFGKKLLQKAEEIAFWNGMNGLVIISGIGVREYYEKRGYYLENNYMVKDFMIYTVFKTVISQLSLHNIVSYTNTLSKISLLLCLLTTLFFIIIPYPEIFSYLITSIHIMYISSFISTTIMCISIVKNYLKI